MNSFLKQCRKLIDSEATSIIVLGNESCDLDSAVCSLTLAFHYHTTGFKGENVRDTILPVLNVKRIDLPLKTEVVHFFKQNSIEIDHLICRDEISINPEKHKIILVDHHVSSLSDIVIAVVDHRPRDSNAKFDENVDVVLQEVGSCATLVAKIIHESGALKAVNTDYDSVMKLLHSTIILDTVNFSKEAGIARVLDSEIVELIENYLNLRTSEVADHRETILNDLVQARADVKSLDSLQILSKDLKLISNQAKTMNVAIPGYPILVQDYIKMDRARENLQQFATINGCDVIVLMGMKVVDGNVRRDLGIINIKNAGLFEEILSTITGSKNPDFCLGEHTDVDFLNGKFYEQCNVKASRKKLLPLIKSTLSA